MARIVVTVEENGQVTVYTDAPSNEVRLVDYSLSSDTSSHYVEHTVEATDDAEAYEIKGGLFVQPANYDPTFIADVFAIPLVAWET